MRSLYYSTSSNVGHTKDADRNTSVKPKRQEPPSGRQAHANKQAAAGSQ